MDLRCPFAARRSVLRMWSGEEYERVAELLRAGMNDCAIARATGISRGTVKDWRHKGRPGRYREGRRLPPCPVCEAGTLDSKAYAHLLGLYLGDGCIVRVRRVWCLRIFQDSRYQRLIAECAQAMAVVSGRRPGVIPRKGCVSIAGYWKHWPCVFPQHGRGRKHLRKIALASWQEEAVTAHPEQLLRGLINSDGCRVRNRVNGKVYPRYEFTNRSQDIHAIFRAACDAYGIRWTRPKKTVVSIARAPDIARLDLVIGAKS